jgi:hypothetical protein
VSIRAGLAQQARINLVAATDSTGIGLLRQVVRMPLERQVFRQELLARRRGTTYTGGSDVVHMVSGPRGTSWQMGGALLQTTTAAVTA